MRGYPDESSSRPGARAMSTTPARRAAEGIPPLIGLVEFVAFRHLDKAPSEAIGERRKSVSGGIRIHRRLGREHGDEGIAIGRIIELVLEGALQSIEQENEILVSGLLSNGKPHEHEADADRLAIGA